MEQGRIKVQFRKQKVSILKNLAEGIMLYVPSVNRYSTISEDAIIKYAAKAANIAENDMRATFEALADAFEFFLTNGHSFKVDGIGTFSLSVRANQALASDANAVFGADAVTRVGVNFLPSKEIKQLIESAAIETEVITDPSEPDGNVQVVRKAKIGDSIFLANGERTGTTISNITAGTDVVVYGYNIGAAPVHFVGESEDEVVEGDIVWVELAKDGDSAIGRFPSDVASLTQFGGIDVSVGGSYVQTVLINGSQYTTGQSCITGIAEVVIYGRQLRTLSIKWNGIVVTRTKNTDAEVRFAIPVAVGNNILLLGNSSYSIVGVDGSVAHVATLTANGISCVNGETSPVIRGRTYQFIALGQGLKNITPVYAHGRISIASRADNRLHFLLTVNEAAVDGTLTIGDFSVQLSVETGDIRVANINGEVSDGGSMELEVNVPQTLTINFASAVTPSDRDLVWIIINGSEPGGLTWAEDGMSMSVNHVFGMYNNPVRVLLNEATIFACTIVGYDDMRSE